MALLKMIIVMRLYIWEWRRRDWVKWWTVVHTLEVFRWKACFVFIHGFLSEFFGSRALFYKIYLFFIEYFTVLWEVFLDLPSMAEMGEIDHPRDLDREPTNLQVSVEYFVGYLERCRKAFLLNTDPTKKIPQHLISSILSRYSFFQTQEITSPPSSKPSNIANTS